MAKLSSLARGILDDLLADFRARNLGSNALREGYEGASLSATMQKHLHAGALQVDFDLAMQELESGKLVGTGPMEAYENDPNSSVFVVALFSKREYAYLTKEGYRAAQKAKPDARPGACASVHISGSTFHNSPVGVGGQITQSVNVNVENQPEVVEYLLRVFASGGMAVNEGARQGVEELVEVARRGELDRAKPIFQRLFGEATDGAKQVAWGVIATIVAKYFGL